MDLSQASLSANGGSGGAGGSIDLSYSSSDELLVADISAIGTSGGNISISNEADADLALNVSGAISTYGPSADALSGSTSLSVSDPQTNSALIDISDDGGFNSIIDGEVKNFSFTALADVTLGLRNITANGNFSVCADGSGSCSAAMAPAALISFAPSKSKVRTLPTSVVRVLGGVNVTVDTFENEGGLLDADDLIRINTTLLKNEGQLKSRDAIINVKAIFNASGEGNLLITGIGSIISGNTGLNPAIVLDASIAPDSKLRIAGSQVLSAVNQNQEIHLRASTDPVTDLDWAVVMEDNSAIDIRAAKGLIFAGNLVVAQTASVNMNDGELRITSFHVKNAGRISAPTLLGLNTIHSYTMGGIIRADQLILASGSSGSLATAELVSIDNQKIQASGQTARVQIIAKDIDIGPQSTVDGSRVDLAFTRSVNVGSVHGSENITLTTFPPDEGTPVASMLGLDGTLDSPTLVIVNPLKTSISQKEITGLITASNSRSGIGVDTTQGSLKVAAVDNLGGAIAFRTESLITIFATVRAQLGDVDFQARNAAGQINFLSGSQVTAVGGSSATITTVTGSVPAQFTSIQDQANVELKPNAQNWNGSVGNVFFGTGLNAVGDNSIEIAGNGVVRFNGTGITLSGTNFVTS